MNSTFPYFTKIQKIILFIILAIILIAIFNYLAELIPPFLFAFIFSYLLSPLVDRLEFIFQKRILAVIALYIGITIGIIFLFNYIIPPLVSEFNELTSNLPFYGSFIKEWSINLKNNVETNFPIIQQLNILDNIQKQIQTIIFDLAQRIPKLFFSTFSTISYLLLIPVILFFFLFQGPDIKMSFFRIIPNKYFEVLIYLFYSIGNKIGNYLRGIFIETLIVGSLSFIVLLTLGANYSVLLGTLAGIMNLIPYLGPVFGAIPAIIVLYLQFKSLNIVLYIIIGFGLIQMIDNIVLKPIIYSQSVDIHPLAIFIFLLIGGMIAGVWGLILAVPIAGILKVGISILAKEIKFRIKFNKSLESLNLNKIPSN
ncbi:MAG: hypothetical protein CMP21_08970 [Rickettsiales bacterium]|nr:hypothetical protein [Rickettsiales bacterium]|tara:strand:- start:5132 stop:6235 length:1104 start_codon:yes stop_codon:yes gene_type:complete